jgi:hypothetical protein
METSLYFKDFEGFRIKINPTILRSTPYEIAKGFIGAL